MIVSDKQIYNSEFYQKIKYLQFKKNRKFPHFDKVIFELAKFFIQCESLPFDSIKSNFSAFTIYKILVNYYHHLLSVYYLDKKLFDAFANSDIPHNIKDLKQVIPFGILMLPNNALTINKTPVNFIAFEYLKKNDLSVEHIRNDKEILASGVYDQNYISWFTILKGDITYCRCFDLNTELQSVDFQEKQYQVNTIVTDEDRVLENIITSILVQSLFYLQYVEPEIVDLSNVNALNKNQKFNKKKTKSNKLNPVIIGHHYQYNYDNKASQTTSSKNVHWRKGFYRKQPYGKSDNKKYKNIWIQPVLVNKSKL